MYLWVFCVLVDGSQKSVRLVGGGEQWLTRYALWGTALTAPEPEPGEQWEPTSPAPDLPAAGADEGQCT